MAPPLSDELSRLLNLRGNLKGRITRIENYVNQVKDQAIAKNEYEQLQIRSTDLTTLFDKYNDTQDQLETLQNTGEDYNERSAIEDKYYRIKAIISSLVQENSANDTLQFKPKKPPIAMPRLNIPQFNGDIKNWPIFKNLFYSVIDNNEDLPKLQKLHYLKSFLEGEAAALLNSLILSEENYEKALDILTKRYDNKLIVINHHLKSFMNYQFITKSSLKEFLTLFQQSFDSLKSLQIPIEHWDVLLIYIIVQKLDNSLRAAWEISRQSSEIPKLSDLLDFLTHRSIAQELINDKYDKQSVPRYSSNTKATHATTFNRVGCILCDSKHDLSKCPLFLQLPVAQRITLVKSKKLCYNCLSIFKPGHHCSQVCSKCYKKHNSVLHIDYTKQPINTDGLNYNSSPHQTSKPGQQTTTTSNSFACVNSPQSVESQHQGSSTNQQTAHSTTNKGMSNPQFNMSIIDSYKRFMERNSDPRTEDWTLMSGPGPLLTLLATYLYFCTSVGPSYMRDRKPYDLKNTIVVYNIIQVLGSMFLVYEGLVSGWWNDYNFSCQPVDYSENPKAKRMAAAVWWYFMAKIVELLDTIFFVLRKKNRQISFLHLYHHFMMPICAWIGVKFLPGGHGTLLGVINSFIHIIMYTYYLISGLGPQYQKYLWWKKHVTTLQLIQFGIIFYHNFSVMFCDCNYPKFINFLLSLNAGLFLYMFGKFYYVNYIKDITKRTYNGFAKKDAVVNGDIKNNGAINKNGETQRDAGRETEISNGKTKEC